MTGAPRRDTFVTHRTRGGVVNWGLIATFAVVIAGLLFVLYGLIRPFTHFDHDHRDVYHPPHID
jgi:hypothetical protein